MSEKQMQALLLLAGFQVKRAHKLPNGYCPLTCACPICATRPWWLVETELGIVRIGWRKRVIHIDWASTDIRGIVTTDDCTKDETMVHAWGYAKAVEHLTNLRQGAFVDVGKDQVG